MEKSLNGRLALEVLRLKPACSVKPLWYTTDVSGQTNLSLDVFY